MEKLARNIMSEAAVVSEIRRSHPLFQQLTPQGSRMFFRQGKISFVRPLQILFKENEPQSTLALPLYGKILLRGNSKVPTLVDANESLGEEALFMTGYTAR
eukprot:TRINITY_DN1906_c0_g1_i1.p4 TRINITY_DN1906_c0_g1~~TRINITY_DN1906_c0_g1_i1.p4  ORF type:complete len:101 (-),score=25.40 TRINITY_DN1906_c0_g1_i1:356-658(-)